MPKNRDDIRVLIVAEHASARYGGEAILPLHLFRVLRSRGIEAWLVVHSRTSEELRDLFPDEGDRLHFVPETWLHGILFRLGEWLPHRISYFTLLFLSRFLTQRVARSIVRRLVAEHRIDVVHQPIPVSPREPSILFDVGAPIIMGPLNGGMNYPPAFQSMESPFVAVFVWLGRWISEPMNRLMPGKLRAAILMVANERTRQSLPDGIRGEVVTMVENGVDLSVWHPAQVPRTHDGPVRFIYLGRLIDLKGVDFLIEAFRGVIARSPATLDIVGDGPLRKRLEARVRELGLADSIRFDGWQSHEECVRRLRHSDVLVLPSLHDCGGAVVLEAMATGVSVIASNWGGPADYLDDSCGILVAPDSKPTFLTGLTDAMVRLANDPDLRAAIGRAGRAHVVREFDWEQKIDRFLEFYEQLKISCNESSDSWTHSIVV